MKPPPFYNTNALQKLEWRLRAKLKRLLWKASFKLRAWHDELVSCPHRVVEHSNVGMRCNVCDTGLGPCKADCRCQD
jgi:hypothetical protein